MDYYKIGYITNTLGIRGELKVQPLTGSIDRYGELEFCYIDMGKAKEKVRIEYYKPYRKETIVIKLEGYNSINEVEKFKGKYLVVDEENLAELEEGRYYIFQIIGCRVKTENGEEIGEVTEVLQPGGNDVYVAKGKKGEVLIPAVRQVVKRIDINNGVIIVDLPEGLIE
jgi:16S rRNA processing protein RimM